MNEEESAAADERFHGLVEAITDYALHLLDLDGCVRTWNSGAVRTTGYAPSEVIGRHFSVFYTPEDQAAGSPACVLDTVRSEGRFEEDGWRVRKDGVRFWANVVVTPVRDEGGAITGFAQVMRDLTERRAAERELRDAERRFHHLVDAVTDYAIYMLDATGHVATWNSGAARAKGYEPHEIIGRHFSIFYSPEDRAAGRPAQVLEIARTRGRFEEEGWRVRKDGTRFWASVVLTVLPNEAGEAIAFAKVTRDLTARREAEATERALLIEQAARAAAARSEEAALAAARRAENATRLKDEFLATVSHELRTPLNALVGYSAILRTRAAVSSDPSLLKPVEAIHRNALSQARIIDDILDVSRIVTGKLHLDVKATDLGIVCEEAIDVVRPGAQAKQITLELRYGPEPSILIGDPERLRQVVWNLLSNSLKFTDRGGKISVAVWREGASLELEVADTGRGIAAEFLPHVFERFKQADSSTTRRVGGLGLGLAIVRHIVELHGGRVSAASDGTDKGATFRVSLPAERAEVPLLPDAPESVAPTAPRPAPVVETLRGLRVLVVDDDPDTRDLLRVVLDDAGAEVSTADSAVTAHEAVRRARPHVLVTDIGMPVEDGYALMRAIRAKPVAEGGALPAIALTAFTRPEDRAKAFAAGFTSHLGKPVTPEELVAAVASLRALARS